MAYYDFEIKIKSERLAGILNSVTAWLRNKSGNPTINGIIFYPKTAGEDKITGREYFYKDVLAFQFVYSVNINNETKLFFANDFDDERFGWQNAFRVEGTPMKEFTFSQAPELDPNDTPEFRAIEVLATPYSGLSEFDASYLSLSQLMFTAGIVLSKVDAGTYRYLVNPDYYGYYREPQQVNSSDMYLKINRAFTSFNVEESTSVAQMTTYTTLIFSPFPIPILANRYMDPALAYEIGLPCPPRWNPIMLYELPEVLRKFEQYDAGFVNTFPPERPFRLNFIERITYDATYRFAIAASIIALGSISIQVFNLMKK